jgi:hypothetical protein
VFCPRVVCYTALAAVRTLKTTKKNESLMTRSWTASPLLSGLLLSYSFNLFLQQLEPYEREHFTDVCARAEGRWSSGGQRNAKYILQN